MGEEGEPRTGRRLTVQQAADQLEITVDAVRGRIKRGTLAVEREGDRVYVLLAGEAYDQPPTSGDQSTGQYGEPNTLISQMQGEIDYLRDENRRKDEIIMQQAVTMRALTAPSQEPPESLGPRPGTDTPTEPAGEPEWGSQRPWWRRLF